MDPSPDTVCAYLEYLAQNFKSNKSLKNYFGAIRLIHKFAQVQPTALDTFQVALMLRATALTMREIPLRRPPVTTAILFDICKLCTTKGKVGLVIRLALLTAFYAFMRASNLCPYKATQFDPTRQFTRADVKIAPPGLVLRMKWSKTLQTANQPIEIPVPEIQHPVLNAVQAFRELCQLIPASANDPLFVLPHGKCLTVSQLRAAFKVLLRKTGHTSHKFSVHSLRRGGASESYAQGAKYLDIQRQGGWASNCFMDYLTRTAPSNSTVVTALIQAATFSVINSSVTLHQ